MLRKWAVRHEREPAATVGALEATRSDRGTRDPVIEFESVTLAHGRGDSAVRARELIQASAASGLVALEVIGLFDEKDRDARTG